MNSESDIGGDNVSHSHFAVMPVGAISSQFEGIRCFIFVTLQGKW